MASTSATKGFRLNHTGLRVADIDRAVNFYTKAFGMKEQSRTVMDTVTVAILGYEDAEDSHLPVLARRGLLELVCSKDLPTTADTSNNPPNSRFVKLMFTVPDMDVTMKHLKSLDIKIVKDYKTNDRSAVCASFLGCELPEKGLDKGLWAACSIVAFVQDPDGYLVEVMSTTPEIPFGN